MSKSHDDDVRERELDAAIKDALARGNHKLADALIEVNKVETEPAGEIL